ncbi:hypothetical protein AAFF_G00253290 [Aldrovandia affinis]|uniref:WW domain binding protein 1 n=1 Tax=Aldrovandia affinis TaxID=143900 RepID=A0AAD7STW8_9TELE|nr:hypothetical protein AAFF_G00253290 [Aldrovandia affinis]
MPQKALGPVVALLWTGTCLVVQGREFCFGVNNEQYRCDMGYCCGETECCTYYYELWWFWLVWTLIIMLSCCCAYRHRRVKMRLQQEQRQREISLMAYQGASSSFITPPPLNLRFWTDCKLPDYEERPPWCWSSRGGRALRGAGRRFARGSGGRGSSRRIRRREEEEEEAAASVEEQWTRRRHVTGDSGIEVCVCQLDADEGSGPEEEDEEEGLCQGGPRGDCCSQRSADRHKEWSPDPRQAPPAAACSNSSEDGLV